MNSTVYLRVSLLLLLTVFLAGATRESVINTKHNLSVTGRGDIRAMSETRICIFCHSSHDSSDEGPLWNHEVSRQAGFRSYDRATMIGEPGQPNGATRLCLSCHDGTIAVGSVHSEERIINMRGVGGAGEIPSDRKTNLGTDLSGTHPVSVRMSEDIALRRSSMRWPPFDPAGEVQLDDAGYVQCTSCHDPHGSKSVEIPFWQKESFAEVCRVCHAY